MPSAGMGQSSMLQQLLPMVVGMGVLALVLWRRSRARQLRLGWMWVIPLLITLLCVGAIWRGLATGMQVGSIAATGWLVSLAAGCLIGWWRGSLMRISVDPETESLTSQASPIGLLLIVGVFLGRYALRLWLDANPGALGVSAYIIADGFLLFAAGLVVTQRIEMWLRARRQLAIARAGGPTSSGVGDDGASG